jgi:hypothetical protein
MKYLWVIFSLFLASALYSQTIDLNSFDKKLLSFQFTTTFDSRIWPSKNNMKSLIIIKPNQYVIQRKHNEEDEIIVPSWDNLYKNFEIQARIKLKNSVNPNPSTGICFNLSRDLSRGYILEFNSNKEFCIKKIVKPGKYMYITNPGTKNPWKKLKTLEKSEEFNNISILVKGNVIDIYINNFFAFSFIDELAYNEIKNFGIYIAPASEAILTNFNFLVNSNDSLPDLSLTNDNTNTNNTTNNTVTNDNPDMVKPDDPPKEIDTAMASYLLNLKSQLEIATKDLKDLRVLLNRCKDDNYRLNEFLSQNVNPKLLEKLKALQQENKELQELNIQLGIDNQNLQIFKQDCIDQSPDKELTKILYQQLSDAQNENSKLKARIAELEKQLQEGK